MAFDMDWTRYRIVDLSLPVVPGEGGRRCIVTETRFEADDSYQLLVDMTTHLGTHIEAPRHYYRDGDGIETIPLSRCIGPMVLARFDWAEPRARLGPQELARATEGLDLQRKIVLLTSPHRRTDVADPRPLVQPELVKVLVDAEIRLFGFDTSVSIDESKAKAQAIHHMLFGMGIPILEFTADLSALARREAFLIALPLRIAGWDASPVRAIALEEVN